MRYLSLATILILGAASTTAFAASPFDGTYKGSGGCPGNSSTLDVLLAVTDGAVSGSLRDAYSTVKFDASVASDGTLKEKGEIFQGKFDGDNFTGTYMSLSRHFPCPMSAKRIK